MAVLVALLVFAVLTAWIVHHAGTWRTLILPLCAAVATGVWTRSLDSSLPYGGDQDPEVLVSGGLFVVSLFCVGVAVLAAWAPRLLNRW
jgi:hypothetical protein